MECESLIDLDEIVIVKSQETFYEGNIFIDDGMIAICRFDMYQVELDISQKLSVDLFQLFDWFEEEFSEIYDQLIEFYQKNDYLALGDDILSSIIDPVVKKHCFNLFKPLLKIELYNESVIPSLNEILQDSKLSNEQIPIPKSQCIYHTTRTIFQYRDRDYPQIYHRFTVAKPILEYLNHFENYNVRIEMVHGNQKIQFHVMENHSNTTPTQCFKRKMLNNGDSSIRVHIPKEIYQVLSYQTSSDAQCFISIDGDDLIFSLVNKLVKSSGIWYCV